MWEVREGERQGGKGDTERGSREGENERRGGGETRGGQGENKERGGREGKKSGQEREGRGEEETEEKKEERERRRKQDRKEERERRRKGRIFHLLLYCPRGAVAGAVLDQTGAYSGLPRDVRAQALRSSSCFPRHMTRELGWS